MGPWSAPVPLNDFDSIPLCFTTQTARKYIVSMVTDHRIPQKYAGRIILQEYPLRTADGRTGKGNLSKGDKIFLKVRTSLKETAGIICFSRIPAPGAARSDHSAFPGVWGPYEMYQSPRHGENRDNEAFSILTTRHHEDYPLQKQAMPISWKRRTASGTRSISAAVPLQPERSGPQALPGCRRYPPGA